MLIIIESKQNHFFYKKKTRREFEITKIIIPQVIFPLNKGDNTIVVSPEEMPKCSQLSSQEILLWIVRENPKNSPNKVVSSRRPPELMLFDH